MTYDEDVNYSNYSDDDEEYIDKINKKKNSVVDASPKSETPINRKINHITDTSSYDSTEIELISPEEVEKEYLNKNEFKVVDYADPVMDEAVKNVERRLGRKINYDEFDKMCKTYAAELVNADARLKNTQPNQQDYELYYSQLIQNKRIEPKYKSYAKKYEQQKVDEIYALYEKTKQYTDNARLNVKLGTVVNMRHKGDVEFEDTKNRRTIKINNGKDVALLHMKQRKDFLDKKFGEVIKEETGQYVEHDLDGFE